jgi:hypothetical protein
MVFSQEKLKELSEATNKLYEKQKGGHIRNNNVIVIYCPPKVGSTSLVSSLRLFACDKFTIHHWHDDTPLQYIINKNNITIMDIIKYNNYIGKNVWVIDIYRTPLERKMSEFFEYITHLHFNTAEEQIKQYSIDKLTTRFNNIFRHIANEDYYEEKYDIPFPVSFDFSKKYILQEKDGIKYIKLRLQDSHLWGGILTNILGIDVKIVRDYETEKKMIGDLYKMFKREYKIPVNFLEEIKNDPKFHFYNSEEERNSYIYGKKVGQRYEGYNMQEYNVYKSISLENSKGFFLMQGHYMDQGCLCEICSDKRKTLREKVYNGMVLEDKIWHNEAVLERRRNQRMIAIAMMRRRQQQNQQQNNMLRRNKIQRRLM